MSPYEEILETSEDGRFRVKLVLDEYPDEPYDDGQSPLLQIDTHGYDHQATHVMATGRPLDDDDAVEYAVRHWQTCPADSSWRLFEKYLRAFFGVTTIETWYSGLYWYVTYDPARWREHTGAPEGSVDMSEWRAYCEGDVWGYVVQKRVTWHTDDPGYDDEDRWEDTEESCWGFYGSDGENGKYLRESALEAMRYEDEPYAHMAGPHETRPDLLSRWDRKTVKAKHARLHEMSPDKAGHRHPDPHTPYATEADVARNRLEHLRRELRAERISQGELCELAGLIPYIGPGDTELLEAAGVPEHPEP